METANITNMVIHAFGGKELIYKVVWNTQPVVMGNSIECIEHAIQFPRDRKDRVSRG